MYIDIAHHLEKLLVEAFSLQYIIYTTIPIIFSLLEDIEKQLPKIHLSKIL